MTSIRIHGILGQEFAPQMELELDKPRQVVEAITANRKNFTNRIHQLAREGCHYVIMVNRQKIGSLSELDMVKKVETIDLVPAIGGSAVALGAGIMGVFGAGSVAVTAWAGFVGTVALTVISVGLQLALAPKPDAGPPISAQSRALQDSYSFSNKANVASQGSPVPVGYGRLIVGSQVIQFSTKSFPQDQKTTDTMLLNPFSSSEGSQTDAAVLDSRKV